MRIRVACDESRGVLRNFWCGTGFSPAKLLLSADMRQQMAYAGSIPHGAVRYARVHYLLELVRAEGLGTASPRYDWSALDQALDTLAACGLVPFFELMGNPAAYFTDFEDDVQVRAWRGLVRDLALRYIAKYGAAAVRQWYFETWNEPDGWWRQSHIAFCNYYDACSEGLKDADPALRFGGPGTCRNLSDLFKALMAHCDSGRNYFTGETGVRLDFISTHEKGAAACREDIDPDSARIIAAEARTCAYLREHHPRLASRPLMNNECDPQVGWWDLHTWHGKPYYAALIAKIVCQHQEAFLDRMGLDYALLSNDNGFVGEWGNRTLAARFGEIGDDRAQREYRPTEADFIEDPARRRFAMVKKPALGALALLALLGDRRCAVYGAPDACRGDVAVLAATGADDQVTVLVCHSRDKIMSSGEQRLSLELTGLPFDKATRVEYRIEDGRTDPFTVWAARGHRRTPTPEDLAAMRLAAEIAMEGDPTEVATPDGRLTLECSLPLPAVRLYVFSRKPANGPDAVQAPQLESYEGLHSGLEDVLIRWPGLPSRCIRTYEVLESETPDGRATRINGADTFCTAWLHTRPRNAARWYRVRAVDFWGRTGAPSPMVRL